MEQPTPAPTTPTPDTNVTNRQPGMPKWLIGVLIGIGVLLIVLTVVILVNVFGGGKKSNTSNNTTSEGIHKNVSYDDILFPDQIGDKYFVYEETGRSYKPPQVKGQKTEQYVAKSDSVISLPQLSAVATSHSQTTDFDKLAKNINIDNTKVHDNTFVCGDEGDRYRCITSFKDGTFTLSGEKGVAEAGAFTSVDELVALFRIAWKAVTTDGEAAAVPTDVAAAGVTLPEEFGAFTKRKESAVYRAPANAVAYAAYSRGNADALPQFDVAVFTNTTAEAVKKDFESASSHNGVECGIIGGKTLTCTAPMQGGVMVTRNQLAGSNKAEDLARNTANLMRALKQ